MVLLPTQLGAEEALVLGLVEVGTLAEVSPDSPTRKRRWESCCVRAQYSNILITTQPVLKRLNIHCLLTNALKSYEVLSKTHFTCVFLHNLKVL